MREVPFVRRPTISRFSNWASVMVSDPQSLPSGLRIVFVVFESRPAGGVPSGGLFAKTRTPEHSEPGILVAVVTGNFLHEHHDAAPQDGIINSHERFDQP